MRAGDGFGDSFLADIRVDRREQRAPFAAFVLRAEIGGGQRIGDAARQHDAAQSRSLNDVQRAQGGGVPRGQREGQRLGHDLAQRGEIGGQHRRAPSPARQVVDRQRILRCGQRACVRQQEADIIGAVGQIMPRERRIHPVVIGRGGRAKHLYRGHPPPMPRPGARVERNRNLT